ncbi:MAG: BlaI/MecI/CopY family transcriptional regulator [Rhodothermales bacterium]
MKDKNSPMDLGARERQIMTFIYRKGEATAAEVMEGISNPPSYSGVRAMLRILEDKGYVNHRKEGARYVFVPTITSAEAGRSAIDYMIQAFFSGSAERAVAALLDVKSDELSESDLERLSNMIENAKQQEDK